MDHGRHISNLSGFPDIRELKALYDEMLDNFKYRDCFCGFDFIYMSPETFERMGGHTCWSYAVYIGHRLQEMGIRYPRYFAIMRFSEASSDKSAGDPIIAGLIGGNHACPFVALGHGYYLRIDPLCEEFEITRADSKADLLRRFLTSEHIRFAREFGDDSPVTGFMYDPNKPELYDYHGEDIWNPKRSLLLKYLSAQAEENGKLTIGGNRIMDKHKGDLPFQPSIDFVMSCEYGVPFNPNPEDIEHEEEWYRYLTPEEFKKYRMGVCWDFVTYLTWRFEKDFPELDAYPLFMHNPDWREDDEEYKTHSVFIVEYEGRFYWIEGSWADEKGVKAYDSLTEAIEDIRRRRIEDGAGRNVEAFMYDPLDPEYFGKGCDEVLKMILNDSEEDTL